MKRSQEFTRRIRQLHQRLTRRWGSPRVPSPREPADELLLALLGRAALESRALAALRALRQAMVDFNDLRVTPPRELVELFGNDFPRAAETAAGLLRVLQAVFNRKQSADLDFLKTMKARDARRFFSGIMAIDPHAVAWVLLRCYGVRGVPLDAVMLNYLRHEGMVEPNWSHVATQEFVKNIIPASQSVKFYYLLKRHAHGQPRYPDPAPAPVVATPAPATMSMKTPPGKSKAGVPTVAARPPSGKSSVQPVRSHPLSRPKTKTSRPKRAAAKRPARRPRPVPRASSKRGKSSGRGGKRRPLRRR